MLTAPADVISRIPYDVNSPTTAQEVTPTDTITTWTGAAFTDWNAMFSNLKTAECPIVDCKLNDVLSGKGFTSMDAANPFKVYTEYSPDFEKYGHGDINDPHDRTKVTC